MKDRLLKLVAAAAKRERPLQALVGLSALAGGVASVAGEGWAAIVCGALLLVDVVTDGLPRGGRRTAP